MSKVELDKVHMRKVRRYRENITIWVSEEDKALYEWLRDEKRVNVSMEAKDALGERLRALKAAFDKADSAA